MTLDHIRAKAADGGRLTPEEGLELFACRDLHKLVGMLVTIPGLRHVILLNGEAPGCLEYEALIAANEPLRESVREWDEDPEPPAARDPELDADAEEEARHGEGDVVRGHRCQFTTLVSRPYASPRTRYHCRVPRQVIPLLPRRSRRHRRSRASPRPSRMRRPPNLGR